MCEGSLPQARVCDLITSREAEKSQRAFHARLLSPGFMSETLLTPKRGAFSPKLRSAASEGVRSRLGPRKRPEGRVASAASGVAAELFPRHGVVLLQEGGVGASPVSALPAPPAAAQSSHQLSLHESSRLGKRHPVATAPLHGVFYVGQVQRVQDPDLSLGAGASPTPWPLLENDGVPLPLHRAQALLLLHQGDGYWRTFGVFGLPV